MTTVSTSPPKVIVLDEPLTDVNPEVPLSVTVFVPLPDTLNEVPGVALTVTGVP